METWINKEKAFEGAVFDVTVGTVRLPNGIEARRDVVEHDGGVCVLPYANGAVTLVRQYRPAVNAYLIELPAGRLEGDEDPEHRARLELEEEVGLRAEALTLLAKCLPSPGYTTEIDYIYLATGLTAVTARPEPEEFIEVITMPLEEAISLLEAGTITDANAMIGLRELEAYLRNGSTVV